MKVKKIKEKILWQWKLIEYLAYSVIFLTPLYFNNKYNLFMFGLPKTILIIGIVLLMTIFYSWGLLVSRKISFRFTPLHIIMGIFLLILTLSSVFGIDPLNSFFGRWTEGINLILLYALGIFAFFIGFLIKNNKKFLPKILTISFISSIFVVITSFFIHDLILNSGETGSSTIGNSSYTGAYLIFNVCFGLGLFFYYSKIWQKILVIIGTIFITFSTVFINSDIFLGKIGFTEIIQKPFILLGQANAATIGLILSFLVIISFFFIFSSKKITKIIGVILLFGILLGIFYTGFQLVNPKSYLNRSYVQVKDETRFIAWNAAQGSFKDHPFLGSGFNNFSYNYQKYFTSDILKEKIPELYFNQPHNVVWEYASNNGVLGLISFLSLLFFTFFALFQYKEDDEKKYRNIKIALIGALFGYFIQNLFGFDTPVTYLMLFLLIGLAIGESKKEWLFSISDQKRNVYKFISILVIILSLMTVVLFVFLPLKEFKKWGISSSSNNIKERILTRNNLQDISLFGGSFDSSYIGGKFYNTYVENVDKIDDSNKSLYLEEIKSIINQLDIDIKKQPNEIRAYIIASQFINLQIYISKTVDEEIWNKSINYIKKALILNSQNPKTYIQLAQTYILKEDFKNAHLSIRQAIAIAPSYTKSYEYARELLKINPDTNFQKYVDDMESRWILNQ